jgi:hypothetical protein
MAAYSELQQREFSREKDGYTCEWAAGCGQRGLGCGGACYVRLPAIARTPLLPCIFPAAGACMMCGCFCCWRCHIPVSPTHYAC